MDFTGLGTGVTAHTYQTDNLIFSWFPALDCRTHFEVNVDTV